MSNSNLKLIAIIVMLIDHIGAILLPQVAVLRVIGRIAFPIFCFLLLQGYENTSNLKKYLTRLGIFAIISQIPYYLAFDYGKGVSGVPQLNVFFTLFAGLFVLYVIDSDKYSEGMKIIIALLVMTITDKYKMDYGWFGIMTILVFRFTKGNFKNTVWGLLALNLVYCGFENVISRSYVGGVFSIWPIVEAFSVLALIPIYFYNGKRGKMNKWIFYVFYPAHLLILFFISRFIIK